MEKRKKEDSSKMDEEEKDKNDEIFCPNHVKLVKFEDCG